MGSKIADSFIIECIDQCYSDPDSCVYYDTFADRPHSMRSKYYFEEAFNSKSKALNMLKNWSNPDALFLFLCGDGIDVEDTEVLDMVGNMLKTRSFKLFFLCIDNNHQNYTSAELEQIENLLIKNTPSKTQIILYSFVPSTDVYADWIQKVNTTLRIDYSGFRLFFSSDFSGFNQQKILQSFQHPNCKVKGIDFNDISSTSQVDRILKFFSEEDHELQLIRLKVEEDYISPTVLEKVASIAAFNKLLPEGILWDKNLTGRWLTSTFLTQQGTKTKIKRVISDDIRVPYGRTKLMFIGQGRAGKTSTIKTLMRKGFDPAEDSTKGFDVKMVQAANWKEKTDSNYMAEYLQNAISSDKIESEKKSNLLGQPTSEVGHIANKKQTLTDVKKSPKDRKVGNHDEKVSDAVPLISSHELGFKPEVTDEEVKKYGEIISTGESKLGFSIWDFGGQEVFYTLHHLFLTEYGCYVLVFDMTKINASGTREESLELLKFWLFSKKIHAPAAPVILVGTHSSEFEFDAQKKMSDTITSRVLGHNEFNEFTNGKLCFFPIDNKIDEGIDVLRKMIEKIVEAQSYVTEPVPSSFLRVLDCLLELNLDYVVLEEVNGIMARCGLSRDRFKEALDFLNARGLLNYFQEPVELRRFVVLQPQWMINGLTCVIFDENEHDPPDFDPRFNRIFRRFLDDRVLNDDLLIDIWNRKGHSSEVQNFFRFLMLKSNVMCEYNFLESKEYFVPNLFYTYNFSEGLVEPSAFTGQTFVIDFSGAYNAEVVKDDGFRYIRFLPYGLFERLVCLCVEHSSKFKEKLKPKVSRASAILTFGNEFKYELRICENPEGQRLWIKVIIDREREAPQAMKLVMTVYSMISALKDQYFSSKGNVSILAISLLIPSDKGILAEYENIKARKESGWDTAFWPSSTSEQVTPSDFNFWFKESTTESLTDPNMVFQRLFKKDDSMTLLASMPSRPLPEGLQYHCFLSYKQASAIDLVAKQYYILANRGFKCWYDMQFRDDLTLEAMQKGVRTSLVYCLHLSKDVFPTERKAGITYFVDEELKMAVSLKKPIMLFHHPDTGTHGYWSFGDYIKNAPDVLKPYFEKVESIQLQRRFYLEESTTEQIIIRLDKYLRDSFHQG